MKAIIGVATVYTLLSWGGNPLFCGGVYDRDTKPWVALDVNHYLGGHAKCGDLMLLVFKNGTSLLARAMDAGPLSKHYVKQWGKHLPIVVDVPEHLKTFPGISIPVRMYNLDTECRNGRGFCP